MKNKIKYLIGILSLLFIVGLPSNLQAAGGFVLPAGPIQMQISATKDITVTTFGLGVGQGAYIITVLSDNLSVVTITGINPINVGESEANQPHVITLNSGATAGSAIITFDSNAPNIADQTLQVTVSTTPTPGDLADLGDKCTSDRICSGSELNCTWCEDKPGLPCIDPETSVCLGMNSYNCSEAEIPLGIGDGLNQAVPKGSDLICMANAACKGECVPDYGAPEVPSGIGAASTDLRDQIRSFINIALGFLGTAGAIIVLYGGVLWMTARGNDEQVTKAKSTIVSGVVGIIIILLAWTIVSYVLKLGGQVTT